MSTARTRIYGTDSEGRKVLLYRPGDEISDAEAARRDAPADETPAKPLDRMKLDELRAVCEEEGFDPGDAALRAEFREVIEAGREKRRSNINER